MGNVGRQESRDERRQRQTNEQFEALGRFVQSFEHMVEAARSDIGFVSGISGKRAQFLSIILHHQVMTAKPLYDVFRAITSTVISDPDHNVPAEEQKILQSVLAQVADRYQKLCNKRNDLLHGTWYIGWHSEGQEDFSDLVVAKFKTAAKGLSMADLPKNTVELNTEKKKCEDIQDILFIIPSSLSFLRRPEAREMWPSHIFHQTDGQWCSRRTIQR